MPRFEFDDLPLPMSPMPAANLVDKVYRVYRELAQAKRDAAQREDEVLAEAEGRIAAERKRLASLAAEAFHLRRTGESLRAPLLAAGLDKELHRLELMVQRFDQTLARLGVEVDALEGRVVDEQLLERIEVLTYVPTDTVEPRVREAVEPLVLVDGQVVLLGKVITEVPRVA